MLFEKIFQRDDKSFLLLYYFFLSLVLYFSSILSYYVRNNSWQLPELIFEGTILTIIVFFILSLISKKEKRYIKGTAQWLRIEFLLLIQTFTFAILITVFLKITDNYSRLWFFTYIVFSFILLILIFEFNIACQ